MLGIVSAATSLTFEKSYLVLWLLFVVVSGGGLYQERDISHGIK